MMKFDPDEFRNGRFGIICYSETEASECVKMLYAHGFHWWEGTNLTVDNTQYHRTDDDFIIYYSDKTRPCEYDFFWADCIEEELIELCFYDFDKFIQPIDFNPDTLLELLEK